ncbi:aminoacyl-tRNA hydrolase [Candidatus Micrarchaeota archaeon CG10_big_fil_rev_8_21_14_0_10_59_7]|nr:MAG: aminoacyl-tRNA hydrolase [Candidatus Micrarchaeota archaeon CG10_big_fil_rev_8_21_14_0_10_59_7]
MKQVIVLRADLKMGKGKMVAQGSHASLDAYRKAPDSSRRVWEASGMEKVALKVSSEKELLAVFEKARRAKLPCSLIRDAGHTQIEPGTITACAIGPADENEIDAITGKLKLL